MTRLGWFDATSGVSGDMLLGALVGAGAPMAKMQQVLDDLGLPERLTLAAGPVVMAGLSATRMTVTAPTSHHQRHLQDVLSIVARAPAPIAERASAVFTLLAAAEAAVHQIPIEQVHFHEVGALDAIADVVGVVTGLSSLDLDRLSCSSIALGGGRAVTAHGSLQIPGPAVLQLLLPRQIPCQGGPVDHELATPTGVALLVALCTEFGSMPAMRPEAVGVGAGSRQFDGHANVTRLVLGTAVTADSEPAQAPAVVIETNVDDIDPRLWPSTLAALMDSGAADVWLTPVLMKKGRPAHTLSVLAPPAEVDRMRRQVFALTTSIGVREYPVTKTFLTRRHCEVTILGEPLRIKLAELDGEVVTATPEYEDVAAVSRATGRPMRLVMELAQAAAAPLTRQG